MSQENHDNIEPAEAAASQPARANSPAPKAYPIYGPGSTPPAVTEELVPGWVRPKPEIIPKATYWPVIMALGITFVFFGIVTTWIISAVGVILFIIALIGWIGDVLNEHRELEEFKAHK